MSDLVVVLKERGALFSIDFVSMAGYFSGATGRKKNKLYRFCYVTMLGILPCVRIWLILVAGFCGCLDQ